MTNKNYKANVNEQFVFEEVDPQNLDFVIADDGSFHILHGAKAFRAQIIAQDHLEKKFRIKVNGSVYNIHLADRYDQLVTSLGLKVNNSSAVGEIKAPMPGLVLELNVKAGDQLQKGDAVLILEAMKMENVIKAPGDAEVAEVLVAQGDAVEKNQILIKFA